MTQENVLDLSRASQQLHYHPPLILDQGLPEMAEWIAKCGGWRQYLQKTEQAPWTGIW